MKLSDYVIQFIEKLEVEVIFAFTGGSSAHLIDSIARNDKVQYICHQHEQASAMAADSYARVTKKIGVAITTSGPGATNLLTGCAGAYYDSVPVLFITGQVASDKMKGTNRVRQMGFQETDVVSIFESVTKYASTLKKPEDIRYELEKATYLAMHGRKGPVLIDIPDDFQRADIDENELKGYIEENSGDNGEGWIYELQSLLLQSKKPLLVLGQGVHASDSEKVIRDFIHECKIPAVMTFGAIDLLDFSDRLNAGNFGINGSLYGNYAVKNADLVIIMGTRLDPHLTGKNISAFASKAKKVVIDIDRGELDKYPQVGIKMDLTICADVKESIERLRKNALDTEEWINEIYICKENNPVCRQEKILEGKISPLLFFDSLSTYVSDDATIVLDTGCSLIWSIQAFKFKSNQRCISEFNHTSMGYALPGATGVSFADNSKEVVCITGDGGFQMNMQELITVQKHNLNIKIILVENRGYAMIQQTQDTWIGGRHEAADEQHGLAFPDFEEIAKAYKFNVIEISTQNEVEDKLHQLFSAQGPCFCIVKVPIEARIGMQEK